jgi:ribosomal protein S18 acetylase RimI-like enzyme
MDPKKVRARNRNRNIAKYILIALFIFFISLVFAIVFSILVRKISPSYDLPSVAADMVSGIIAAVAAALVLYELKWNSQERARQNDIDEASFILQYNQSFIQDPNMGEVESLLEKNAFYNLPAPIITDENRQKFVNYLVYLEGLTPVILNGVMSLEHIDNLMAYRFFLAVNNPELQEKELSPFADYYRGCFKLYHEWTEFRKTRHLEIPLKDYALDRLDVYRYMQIELNEDRITCRQLKADDSLTDTQYRDIAQLIYETDPYIYPALFSGCENPSEAAKTVISRLLMSGIDDMFHKNNLFVLFADGLAAGIILWHDGPLCWDAGAFVKTAASLGVILDENCVSTVDNEYFGKQYTAGSASPPLSLINVCVSRYLRGKHLGRTMLDVFILRNKRKDMELFVLADNPGAVKLYTGCGFQLREQSPGFSLSEEKPMCYRMERKGV